MEVMSKAQATLIQCLRISGMTIPEIIDILDKVWDEDLTIMMLEKIADNPTLSPAELYSIACEISEEDKKETELLDSLITRMDELGLKERTIRAIVTTDLLPTNQHLEKMLTKLYSWKKPTDELVLATALLISEEE